MYNFSIASEAKYRNKPYLSKTHSSDSKFKLEPSIVNRFLDMHMYPDQLATQGNPSPHYNVQFRLMFRIFKPFLHQS